MDDSLTLDVPKTHALGLKTICWGMPSISTKNKYAEWEQIRVTRDVFLFLCTGKSNLKLSKHDWKILCNVLWGWQGCKRMYKVPQETYEGEIKIAMELFYSIMKKLSK